MATDLMVSVRRRRRSVLVVHKPMNTIQTSKYFGNGEEGKEEKEENEGGGEREGGGNKKERGRGGGGGRRVPLSPSTVIVVPVWDWPPALLADTRTSYLRG